MIALMYLFINNSFAGDIVTKGTILSEQSYVFTVKEANDLMNKIKEYEFNINNLTLTIEEYKKLQSIEDSKEINYKEIINIKQQEVDQYNKLYDSSLERINLLEKRSKLEKLEKLGFFGTGIALAISSIIIADKIDDSIEKTR